MNLFPLYFYYFSIRLMGVRIRHYEVEFKREEPSFGTISGFKVGESKFYDF